MMKENAKLILAISLMITVCAVLAFAVSTWMGNALLDTDFNIVSYNHSGVLSDVKLYRDRYIIMDFATDDEYAFIQIAFKPVNVETWIDINNHINNNVVVCYNRIEYVDDDFKRMNGIYNYNIFKSITIVEIEKYG